LSVVMTQLRVDDQESPFNGEGFSTISYTSNRGSGEGCTHDRVASPGMVNMNGSFTGPLEGAVLGTLHEAVLPRTLRVTIDRVDLGLPPAPDLELSVWGPSRVSPGQTIDYVIEYRNQGLKTAQSVEVVDRLSDMVDYRSNTGGGYYNPETREVIWRIENVPPGTRSYLTATATVQWGLPQGTWLPNVAFIQDPLDIPVDPAVQISAEFVEEPTENLLRMIVRVSGPSGSGDLHLDMYISDATEEIEPKIEVTETAEGMEAVAEYTVEGSLKLIRVVWKWVKKAYDIGKGAKDLDDAARQQVTYQQLFSWTLEKGWIREDEYKELMNSLELQGALSMSKTGIGKVPNPWAGGGGAHLSALSGAMPTNIRVEMGLALRSNAHLFGGNAPDEFIDLSHDERWQRLCTYYLGESSLASAALESAIAVARDPNIKYGPEGCALPGQKLDYRLEFENVGEGIAFGVYFTDRLDEDLDDSTLQIGPVFSTEDDSEIAPPGDYNPQTRAITWLVGEVGPHEGGYANLSVNVRGDAPEGTEIINFATVYFPSVPEVTPTNAIVSVVPYSKALLKTLDRSAGRLIIEWLPFGDGRYTLQTTGDLASGLWTDAQGDWPSPARWYAVEMAGINQMFIRVKAAGQ